MSSDRPCKNVPAVMPFCWQVAGALVTEKKKSERCIFPLIFFRIHEDVRSRCTSFQTRFGGKFSITKGVSGFAGVVTVGAAKLVGGALFGDYGVMRGHERSRQTQR